MDETLRDLIVLKWSGTIADLAKRCGLSVRAIQDLVRGRVAEPRAATCAKIAKGLTVSPRRVDKAVRASRAAAQPD